VKQSTSASNTDRHRRSVMPQSPCGFIAHPDESAIAPSHIRSAPPGILSSSANAASMHAVYAAIIEHSHNAVIAIDQLGIVVSFNPAAEKMFGYGAAEIIGKNIRILMPPVYRVRHEQRIQQYMATGESTTIGRTQLVAGLRRDGTTFPAEITVSHVRVGERHLFAGIIRDVSDRRRLEREILEVSERERRRIGQDLHDDLGQLLTGLGFMTQSLERRLHEHGLPEAADAREICELVTQAKSHATALSRGLQPVHARPDGLMVALHQLCALTEQMFRVHCSFHCPAQMLLADTAAASHLYRIAQEAVNNAIKHGKADHIDITLSHTRDEVTASTAEDVVHLVIEDDGVGLASSALQGPGMGLHIMQYRAASIGATVIVRRRRRHSGTCVTCSIPGPVRGSTHDNHF
jgi:two-component system sensor kinase FixL